MKKFLLLSLLLLASPCFAGISSILVEHHAAQTGLIDSRERPLSDVAASATVTVYGLLSNGVPKAFTLSGSNLHLVTDLENCEYFGLSRDTLRFWVNYNEDFSLNLINFNMGEAFDQWVYYSPDVDSQVAANLKHLTDWINAQ